MRHQLLTDSEGCLHLINCKITKTQLLAGLAVVFPGLKSPLAIFDPQGNQVCTLQIPEAFQKVCTSAAEIEVVFDKYTPPE